MNYPINDFEAYKYYSKYNFLYNKKFICEFQNLNYGNLDTYPKKYPIISKPIINLKGMGYNAIKINNIQEFINNNIYGNFWCEFVKGKHYSYDFMLNDTKIIFYCCFEGIKNNKNLGKFNYWKFIKDIKYPEIIDELINKYLKKYFGFLNIEVINNKIIEVHLRKGDIDFLPKKFYDFNNNNFDLNEVDDILLFPVWQKNNNIDFNKIYEYLDKKWIPIIDKNKNIKSYYFDRPTLPSPNGCKRWLLLEFNNYNKGYYFKRKIEKEINNL